MCWKINKEIITKKLFMIGHQKPIYLFIYCINSYWETLKLKLDIYTNESLH